MPRGAFYAFPSIKSFGMTSVEAAEHILRTTHVVTSPGSAFGEGGEGFIRICYAAKYEKLREALKRLKREFGEK
jgi:aminotransferase